MKKLLSIFLCALLCFSLSVSVFADFSFSDGDYALFDTWKSFAEEYPYGIIYLDDYGVSRAVFIKDERIEFKPANSPTSTFGDIIYVYAPTSESYSSVRQYVYQDEMWIERPNEENPYDFYSRLAVVNVNEIILTNFNIYDYEADTVYFAANFSPEMMNTLCDGSICPANDSDHDNLCDDCGKVLTYSLRTSLLDFAKYQAEEFGPFAGTHKYYAVVENLADSNSYFIYVSEILMGSTDGKTVTGSNLKVGQVVQKEDGTLATRGGWSSVDSWSGTVVYANQTIPNFFPVPLAVTIQGVTGEQMAVTLPNLVKTMGTLALCGVGLMALLLSLHLLRIWLRRLQIM